MDYHISMDIIKVTVMDVYKTVTDEDGNKIYAIEKCSCMMGRPYMDDDDKRRLAEEVEYHVPPTVDIWQFAEYN